MTIQRSFAQLSLAVQQLGQWENSGDITPAILLQAINYALIEATDIVIKKWEDYYTRDATFATTAGVESYPLAVSIADAFYKLRHLDFSTDGVKFRRMTPYSLDKQYVYSSGSTSRTPKYRIQGQNLIIAPAIAGTIKAYYVPLPVQFGTVDDVTTLVTFDVPVEERLVIHLAMRDLLTRSDLSTQSVDAQIARLVGLLRSAADDRDAGEPFYLDPMGPPRSDWYDDAEWH